MKFQCPYCKEVSERHGRAGVCPKCGKASLSEAFFKKSGKVKRDGRRRERNVVATQPWISSGRIMGLFLLWAKIPRWLIWLCGICLIGAFIWAPKIKVDFPELRNSAKTSLAVLRLALDAFKEDCGRYPLPSEGLPALVLNAGKIPGWRGPYIKKLKPDPWNAQFVYKASADGATMEVYSAGPDKKPGTADDIQPDLRVLEERGPLEVPVEILKAPPSEAAKKP